MNGTVPRHDVVLQHRAAAQERLGLLAELVGMGVIYVGVNLDEVVDVGPFDPVLGFAPGVTRRTCGETELYPERIGCGCRVVSLNETEEHCPLVVEWTNGQRGIVEPGWLAPRMEALP